MSSSSSDDTRLLGMSSTIRGRPPLPPPYGSSLEKKPSRNDGSAVPHILNEPKPILASRSFALQRQHSMVENTIEETQKQLDQEITNQPHPHPHPRRRLASFGGISSPGSHSPFTGVNAYNQNKDEDKLTNAGGDMHSNSSSSLGSRGSTGCLKLSPQSSGRTTPVTSLGPMNLQHVRDQMVVALQRLKELEEQVKIIPILQVKIAVLQEEKRQLASQLSNQSDIENGGDIIWKRAHSIERSDNGNKINSVEGLEGIVRSDCTKLSEFRLLTEEMPSLERNIKGRPLQEWQRTDHAPLHEKAMKSCRLETDTDNTLSKPIKVNKSVYTDQVQLRSIATEVYEGNLGIYTEKDAALDAQQIIICSLKERISHLEAELKESTFQIEMSRLKLELQAAGVRNRADKSSSARPSTVSTGIQAGIHTTSQGVGNHTELRDASTGEAKETKTVGVSCIKLLLKNVCTGPDVPMSQWEVRERVETMEKGTGIHIFTKTQGAGMEVKSCDAETNTDTYIENVVTKKRKAKYNSVACGDFSVDVMVFEAKEVVSHGIATDQVKGVDLGIMASPQTASQRTNTASSSVYRFTNTRNAFNTDSSTNTVLSTKDKHTNTTQTVKRTVSVGDRVKDTECASKICPVCEGNANLQLAALKQTPGTPTTGTKLTKNTGVGFTNISENFLVGLKTRNMASGPSRLPDPIKTRSIGVGDGKILDLSAPHSQPGQMFQQPSKSMWDPDLNHYIEKMHRLLRAHEDLLTQNNADRKEDFVLDHSNQGSTSSKPSCYDKAEAQRRTDVHPFDTQPPVGRVFHSPSQLSLDSSKSDKANPEQSGDYSDVKRMIQMLEQQASTALQDRPAQSSVLRSVVKKHNGDQGCGSNRKSMKFLRVTTGLDPITSFEFSAHEKSNSEEVERRASKKLREAIQDARKVKSGTSKGLKGPAKSLTQQQRSKLNEKMFSACQALQMHQIDNTALSSRELQDCQQTLQQEWFSVSSQKSASPETVEDLLSLFRLISPSVLQHIINMTDGNGNTALHYSVSHSNFGIVKKLLDAEVCKVNQQNKAGYTPIMLAALAAVESPKDMRVVEQLFTKGDVNAKASQAGQTALMLAVSHGRMEMVQALLAEGAEVNLQDDEGSTALMCASEHGHSDIVRLLLAQPGCDAALTDSDDSTALSIALDAGHSEIAVLLYAQSNFSRGQTAAAAHHSGRALSSSSSSSSGGRNIFE